MKSAVFYFNHDDYKTAEKGNYPRFLSDFIRYEFVGSNQDEALDKATPRPGEIVLNSVLLEE